MHRVFVALGLVFSLVGPVIASGTSEALPSIHDRAGWMNALAAKDLDRFTDMLNLSKDRRFPSVPNRVALDVTLERNSLPPEAREAAAIPEFQLEALSYLALAHRNQVMTGYSAPLRALAKRYPLDSRALHALAHFQDKRDIPFLARIADASEPNHYKPAIVALHLMCMEEAKAVLQQVEQASHDRPKRDFMRQAAQVGAICDPPR